MSLKTSLKNKWARFCEMPPGTRFQEIYRKRQAKRQGAFDSKRILMVGGGLALIILGVVFLAMPGPGLLVLLAGLGMMASESKHIAKFLDWADVKTRPFVLWLREKWDHFKHSGKPTAPRPQA